MLSQISFSVAIDLYHVRACPVLLPWQPLSALMENYRRRRRCESRSWSRLVKLEDVQMGQNSYSCLKVARCRSIPISQITEFWYEINAPPSFIKQLSSLRIRWPIDSIFLTFYSLARLGWGGVGERQREPITDFC